MPAGVILARSRGFALIIVLWTMALLSFIIALLTAGSRTELEIARNLVGNAVAQAAADGATFEAIFELMNPSAARRWRLGGSAHLLAIGDSRVRVWISDEAGRINPNLASQALLAALLRVTGSDRARAQNLAAAIEEWVGRTAAPGGRAAALSRYAAAGLDYGPPGAPLETLDELSDVIGMTPAVMAAIRPHLSLYGPGQPDPRAADPVVAAALALSSPALAQPPSLPVEPQTPFPRLLTVRIAAAAQGPGDARATTLVVARVGILLPGGYLILSRNTRLGATALAHSFSISPGSPGWPAGPSEIRS